MANRLNVSFPEDTRAQLDALAALYGGNKSEAMRVAIAQLHQRHFPELYDGFEEPYVKGWDRLVLARDSVCADTGIALPAGTQAWRCVWSDGRTDTDVYSYESLKADGVIID